eukprot:scaffold994_cov242-Pinguiococcus_pyrenoidosus.AAC.2
MAVLMERRETALGKSVLTVSTSRKNPTASWKYETFSCSHSGESLVPLLHSDCILGRRVQRHDEIGTKLGSGADIGIIVGRNEHSVCAVLAEDHILIEVVRMCRYLCGAPHMCCRAGNVTVARADLVEARLWRLEQVDHS